MVLKEQNLIIEFVSCDGLVAAFFDFIGNCVAKQYFVLRKIDNNKQLKKIEMLVRLYYIVTIQNHIRKIAFSRLPFCSCG